MATDFKTIETRDLQVGMVLHFTKEEVVYAPSSGIDTPRGKVDLYVISKAGLTRKKTWNRHTLIAVSI